MFAPRVRVLYPAQPFNAGLPVHYPPIKRRVVTQMPVRPPDAPEQPQPWIAQLPAQKVGL